MIIETSTTTTATDTKAASPAPQRERTPIQLRRTERRPSRRANYTVAPSSHSVPERSRVTALVFQAILGAAACLALVGVVAASQQSAEVGPIVQPGSPDAPPPAVFVHVD